MAHKQYQQQVVDNNMRKNIIFIIVGVFLITAFIFRNKPQFPIPIKQPIGGSVEAIVTDVVKADLNPGLQLYPDNLEEVNAVDFQCNFDFKSTGIIFDEAGAIITTIPMPMLEIVSFKSLGLRNGRTYIFMCVDAAQFSKVDIGTINLTKAKSSEFYQQDKAVTLNFQPITLNGVDVTSSVLYQIEKIKVLNEIIKLQTTTIQANAINDLAKIASKEVCRFVFTPSTNNILKEYLVAASLALKNNQCL